MPATANNWTNIKSWLDADPVKTAASLPEKDDGGKPATEGSRSSENSADVNEVVPGQNVDKGKDNPDDIDGVHAVPGSGLNQSTTGRNSEVEKAVKTVTEESDKMAAAKLDTDADLNAAFAQFNKLAADMNLLIGSARAPDVTKPAAPTKKAAAQPATKADPVDAGLGYATKEAADKAAADVVAGYRQYGADRGMLTARYLLGFEDTYFRLKQAEDSGELEQMMAAQGGGGGAPPGGGDGDADDDAGGGAPPGGDPAAAGGAPPPGGDAGGAPGPDDMAGAMGELNLAPEEIMQLIAMLQQKLQEAQGAGAMPPEAAKAAKAELEFATKLAGDAKALMRSGKFRLKPAADGSPERKGRDAARAYIQELQKANG